ncbi:MAG TPA: hypothetical protein VIY52_20915 [Streptosporangiaceae bacterium]
MNLSYGYQVFQAERTRTRAEVLAEDARRGRTAAVVRRGGRGPARAARAWGVVTLNTIAGRAARTA